MLALKSSPSFNFNLVGVPRCNRSTSFTLSSTEPQASATPTEDVIKPSLGARSYSDPCVFFAEAKACRFLNFADLLIRVK
ncbi:hypothetical protein CK214_24315 [Mesorhizobium sp. WSM3882]|nr:hypothetical protein CK214_24315 [Mesorhizobium sp. WSM3882]